MKAGINRCVLPVVLVLTAGSEYAFAQRFVCYTVQRGDTAARLALRLTGNAHHRYAPWFQIADPRASRFISKAEYGLILPGWRACIAEDIIRTARNRLENQNRLENHTAASAHAQPLQIDTPGNAARLDLDLVWWVAALFVIMLLARFDIRTYLAQRQAMLGSMKGFGDRFIREFERPLIQRRVGEHPIRAQLRFASRRRRLQVLLAPSHGWKYPNLSDHRRNLEYDVERVLQVLGDRRFVSGRPHAKGRWVVIPFQFQTGLKEDGAK